MIDDETWAFIEKTGSFYQSIGGDASLTTLRQVYDRMNAAFRQPYPDGVSSEDRQVAGVACRIYRPPTERPATVIYAHGGGFVLGGLESHDDICAEIAANTGFRVISVDYRLAPEHPHPAALDDCLAVVRAVAAEQQPVVVAGDSAGGNLMASVCHQTRGELGIAGQVLIYPGLGGDHTKGSYIAHAHAPMLTLDDIGYYGTMRFGGTLPRHRDPSFAPLSDQDFSNLPPTLTVTAAFDPLRDDGMNYHRRIVGAGGLSHWVDEPGLIHGYLRGRMMAVRIARSFARICGGISAFGTARWPYPSNS